MKIVHRHTRTHTQARAHTHTHTHTRAHSYTHTHTYTSALTHTQARAHIHKRAHTQTQTQTHTHTHTHTHKSWTDSTHMLILTSIHDLLPQEYGITQRANEQPAMINSHIIALTVLFTGPLPLNSCNTICHYIFKVIWYSPIPAYSIFSIAINYTTIITSFICKSYYPH